MNRYPQVTSYIDKKYIKMQIYNITTACIHVYKIKYPLIIKWNSLKELGAYIDFHKSRKKEWLAIYLPLRNVVDLTSAQELHNFIAKYINI